MKLEARSRLFASGKDATEMFESQVVAAKSAVDYKGRDKLVSMRITDFLKMAKPGQGTAKAAGVQDLLDQGKKFNTLPYLYYEIEGRDAYCTGHEGRHRARALLALGYSTMPVELRGPIRWSEQGDAKRFDYREVWPDSLIGEAKNGAIKFPVARNEANQPYRAP